MSGWEWARYRTAGARARRRRAARARRHVLAVDAAQLARRRCAGGPSASTAIWREQARALPGQVARLTGVPVAHASHVGPVTGETPLGPGIPWRTQMIGESQVCDRDGTILARLTLEDGEGHVAADVELARARAAGSDRATASGSRR